MPKLVLVDAHGYLHRAYHALPPLTTSKGEPVNAIYGFVRMIFKLLREQKPDYFAICFDAPGRTFRDKIYSDYKATRKETEDNLKSQFPLARELVQNMELASFEMEGFEADDLIATLAKKAEQEGIETVIVTSDKDMLQIVDEKIKVYNEPKQTVFDSEKVKEKWGVSPAQIADLFALMGDSTDNVPSVPGIGEKTAVKLIQECGSVEKLLENFSGCSEKLKDKISQHQEQIKLAKQLVTLHSDAPIKVVWKECEIKPMNRDLIVPFLKRMEFHAMVNDLFSKGLLSAPKEESNPVATHYETILTEEQLKRLVAKLESAKRFAVDVETTGLDTANCELVGISFSWKANEAAYIPLCHRYLGAPQQLDSQQVLTALKPVLEDPSTAKMGHNMKFDYSVLVHAGVRMQNLHFDTMVASYCLDPSRSSHRLKDVAQEFLGRDMTRIEELLSSSATRANAKVFPMDQVEVDKASRYACADADCTFQLAEKFEPLLKEKKCDSLFYEIEMPLVQLLSEMEMTGVKVDVPYLEQLQQRFSKEIETLESQAHKLAGEEFNLNSSKQLSFILFEKLKLPTARKTKTGFSTDEEVLRMLSSAHELPQVLIKYRELSKLKSTYIDGLLTLLMPLLNTKISKIEESYGGLIGDHVEKDGPKKDDRIHTSFNQAVAATGRLSSSEPNLQNIPIRTEYGRMIRRAFIPEEGFTFLSADYSQIDLRVLAHLTDDKALCKAFQEGGDVHRTTAAEVFHVSLNDVTDEQRKRAKAINFGIVYGQQSFGLSQSLGIPVKEAQELIENYFKKYSGVKAWIERTIQEARMNGCVKTLSGRIRYINEINSKNAAMRSFAERTAMNTPVQGTSADIIKIAMIKIDRKLKANANLKAFMLLQVHDDLLFEVKQNQVEELARLVKTEMENAMALSVPLVADLKTGANWADMEPFSLATAAKIKV